MLRIRASGPSENAFAKPYARSSAPQAVKGAATRLPSLGPDGPPLTAWLRFALRQRRVARTRNPWLNRGFLPFWGGCAPLLQCPRGRPRACSARPWGSSSATSSWIDSPTHGYVSRSDFFRQASSLVGRSLIPPTPRRAFDFRRSTWHSHCSSGAAARAAVALRRIRETCIWETPMRLAISPCVSSPPKRNSSTLRSRGCNL